MDTALWIIAIPAALAFLATGLFKLATPYSRFGDAPATAWASDFTPSQVKLIGLVEVAGALGLVLPPVVDFASWLTPLAASGLAIDMLGAYATHLRRNDPPRVKLVPTVLGIAMVTVAVGRYWVSPF